MEEEDKLMRMKLLAEDTEWRESLPRRPPVIGLGATTGGFGMDRHPYTVRLVSDDGRTIYVAADNVERTDENGVSESQSYDFFESDNHVKPETWTEYTLRKNGRWVKTGQDQSRGQRITLGMRDRWHNYSY